MSDNLPDSANGDPEQVRITRDESGALTFVDQDVVARTRRTTGLADSDAGLRMIAQVAQVTGGETPDPVPRLNSVAARMHALTPVDAMEGMTDALLVAVQDAALAALADAASGAKEFPNRARCAGAADRLVSAFVRLTDLRTRLRGGGISQRVTVEHVHLAAGAQAVIGAVTGPGGGGGTPILPSEVPHAQA